MDGKSSKGFAVMAGLLLLGGCASAHAITPRVAGDEVAWNTAETLDVRLSNFEFSPKQLKLKAGRPVVLRLHDDEGGHSFAASDFFAAAKVAPKDAAKIAEGEIEMHGGDTVVIQLVPAAGRYDLVCTHTGHALLGMKGEIIVD